MKYRLHENGWTVLIDDVDLRTITLEETKQISTLIGDYFLVVIKGQHLSIEEELRFVKMFDDPKALYSPTSDDYQALAVPNTDGVLLRVGGTLNEYGLPGFGEHIPEMTWHHDFCYQYSNKPPLLYLYAISGSQGSRTSWINNILSYNDLDQQTKDQLQSLEIKLMKNQDFDVTKFTTDESGWASTEGVVVDDYTSNLVVETSLGRKGLYFSFNQIHNFVGMSREESLDIIKPLAEHVTQEKYCYHHDWEDGDVVIGDNRFTLHKRWHCENINTRLLHRAVFGYITQDYK
jgi:alpha-ketoglutarate-dependent taurine dioxygenase